MGTITGAQIIDKVAVALLDTNNLKWARTELLNYINEAQRQVVALQPHSNSTRQSVQLTTGTRQALPTGGYAVLDITRNMGTNGSTPGRAIRQTSRTNMDAFMPDWHSTTASAVIHNFLIDEQEPSAFWVYPPSTGTTYVELVYAKPPTALAAESDAIALSDTYEPAVVDYVMSRAHSKAVQYAGGPELAARYYQNFIDFLGAKDMMRQANTPAGNLGRAATPGTNT